MDRNQDEIIKQVKREEQQAFISKFVKDVNSTVADDFKAIFLIPEAEEKGVLFSRYGKGRDTSESMSHLVQSEDYIIADPAVIDGTKSAEQGTYYMYSKFFDQNQRSPSHKAEKITFNQMLDFVNDGDNPIAKPAKPKLGFWGTIRNALSGLFGKPEGQKKYEREIEVYRAKKCSILESDFKFKVPDYNKKLLDPIAAAEYTEKGNLLSDEELKAKCEEIVKLNEEITNFS